MSTLQQRLERGDVLILDGAMGTELQRRGVPMDGIAWSAAAMATRPGPFAACTRTICEPVRRF